MIKKLLEPVKAGRLTLKNRIMFPPLTTGYEERDGSIGERSLNFYERLAKGGTGYIVIHNIVGCFHRIGRLEIEAVLVAHADKIAGYGNKHE